MDDRRKLANGKEIWVIKAGFPDTPAKYHWSEYSFAHSLKKYLDRLGYYVIIESHDEWEKDGDADVVVVMRGHAEYFPDRRRKNCIYIMWNLSHPDTITDEEYNAYDFVCISSAVYAEKMRERLHVPVEVLPMCADTEIFYPNPEPSAKKEYDWVFVGNSRGVKRRSVMWSISNGIPLKIWGAQWEKLIPDSEKYVVDELLPNDQLPELYRNAKVTVDDHYEDMVANGFVNTRIVEALACGLPVISDYSEVLEPMFGDAILTYRDEADFVRQTERIKDEKTYEEICGKVLELWPMIRDKYSFEACAKELGKISQQIQNRQTEAKAWIRQQRQREIDHRCESDKAGFHPVIQGTIPGGQVNNCVSVIIPVYNVQKYLAQCLDSILSQTLREIEVICVDDGSQDESSDILREYAAKDPRISVYTQENCGAAVARNRGMTLASGEYIYLMDSDDWLQDDALERLYEAARENDLEIVYFNGEAFFEENCGSKAISKYTDYYSRKGQYPSCCSGPEMLVQMRKKKEYRVIPMLQLFRRKFLQEKELLFPEGIIHEDDSFTFRAILSAERVGYVAESFFHRRVHGDSVMQKSDRIPHVYGYFRCLEEMVSFAEKGSWDVVVCEAAGDILRGVWHNLREEYASLSRQEQQAFESLDVFDRLRFEMYLQSDRNSSLEITDIHRANKGLDWKLEKLYREKSELNRKLQQTYTEKSEINRKLQQTYAEKSEINRKLQQTYAEKYERGLRIKQLEKELKGVRKSRTYRLARMIGAPVRLARKIWKKFRDREVNHG
jgi:glycosyltransferase involved in cell wall biosynthesis